MTHGDKLWKMYGCSSSHLSTTTSLTVRNASLRAIRNTVYSLLILDISVVSGTLRPSSSKLYRWSLFVRRVPFQEPSPMQKKKKFNEIMLLISI